MWKLFSKRKPAYHLSECETEILKLIAQGKKNKEIATELKISEQTVKNRITTIFLKLGVTNRTQAALKFLTVDKIALSK
jgi:DNA-binding NarL/FixJ family response regulator